VDQQSDSCGKACYECLLDYGNQGDHRELDRTLIQPLLAGFMRAECKPVGGMGSRSERMAALRARCDSGLEKKWLDLVEELRLNPPSHAQFRIPTYYTQPDFFYAEHNAAIYVDGPPHDEPAQVREDETISLRLMEQGYIVIRFHHQKDWNTIFRRHPDVFGTPRS
jgi:very-short-patch-repair endonuclease